MKIVRLTAENIKKLRAVEITPTGELVIISGRNAQGKTSVLDSIWWALAGTAAIQGQPIRKGQTKARIKLDLGEIVVERKFTPAGSTLSVESADGARFPSPQKMLDALLGELSFDPLAFARMDPREQFDELRRVAKLEIDVDKLDALNRGDFAKRTEVNRDAKAKRAQADAITIPSGIPSERVDEDKLVDELQQAGEHNGLIETRKANRLAVQEAAAADKHQAEEKRYRAARLRQDADAEDAAAAALLKAADEKAAKLLAAPELPKPIDAAAIRVQLEEAKRINAGVAARDRRAEIVKEAEALEAQSKVITETMEAREKAKRDAVKAAAMPVEGLGFGEGVVTYNDVPFDQASSAEQLRVSMGIAIAANPKLRVIRILDGSLLDADSMRIVSEMAKADDFQVWIECVDSSGKLGVVIDDGAVVAAPQKQPQGEPA